MRTKIDIHKVREDNVNRNVKDEAESYESVDDINEKEIDSDNEIMKIEESCKMDFDFFRCFSRTC